MKKAISIFFLLLFLCTTTEMYQLSKLPLLFEHYQAHHMADKNLSVWGFLYEHYVTSNTSDPDYLADMKLPFKSGSECLVLSINSLQFVQQQQQEISFVTDTESSATNYPIYKKPLLISSYLSTIWQPPKAC